jgi:hypothetical protein
MHEKFERLAAFLSGRFDSLAGYRVGTVNVEVFLIGRVHDGGVLGLKASSVET